MRNLDYFIKKYGKKEKEDPNRFRINKYLELRLSGESTVILVNGEPFNQCKFLLFNIPKSEVEKYDEINSIDEAAKFLDKSHEGRYDVIDPRVEFWGHCSNLQTWYENDYDTRLLHSNLAFSLLKKLVEAGDPLARRALKDEIALRLEDPVESVVVSMLNSGLLKYLTKEEKETIAFNLKSDAFKIMVRYFNILEGNKIRMNKKDDILIVDHSIKILTIENDVHYHPEDYDRSYSLEERNQFPKIKFRKTFYDFNLIKKKPLVERHYLGYKDFWFSFRFLNKNSDCKLFIPRVDPVAEDQVGTGRIPFRIESKNEGLVIYIAPETLKRRYLKGYLNLRVQKLVNRLDSRRDKRLIRKIREYYEENINPSECKGQGKCWHYDDKTDWCKYLQPDGNRLDEDAIDHFKYLCRHREKLKTVINEFNENPHFLYGSRSTNRIYRLYGIFTKEGDKIWKK